MQKVAADGLQRLLFPIVGAKMRPFRINSSQMAATLPESDAFFKLSEEA